MKRKYRIVAQYKPSIHMPAIEFEDAIEAESADEAYDLFVKQNDEKNELRILKGPEATSPRADK